MQLGGRQRQWQTCLDGMEAALPMACTDAVEAKRSILPWQDQGQPGSLQTACRSRVGRATVLAVATMGSDGWKAIALTEALWSWKEQIRGKVGWFPTPGTASAL